MKQEMWVVVKIQDNTILDSFIEADYPEAKRLFREAAEEMGYAFVDAIHLASAIDNGSVQGDNWSVYMLHDAGH